MPTYPITSPYYCDFGTQATHVDLLHSYDDFTIVINCTVAELTDIRDETSTIQTILFNKTVRGTDALVRALYVLAPESVVPLHDSNYVWKKDGHAGCLLAGIQLSKKDLDSVYGTSMTVLGDTIVTYVCIYGEVQKSASVLYGTAQFKIVADDIANMVDIIRTRFQAPSIDLIESEQATDTIDRTVTIHGNYFNNTNGGVRIRMSDELNTVTELNTDRLHTMFNLRKARERFHILEGLVVVLENIDQFISIIKNSNDLTEAKIKSMQSEWNRSNYHNYKLSDGQVRESLQLCLYRLTKSEQDAIKEEYKDIEKTITNLNNTISTYTNTDDSSTANWIKQGELISVTSRKLVLLLPLPVGLYFFTVVNLLSERPYYSSNTYTLQVSNLSIPSSD